MMDWEGNNEKSNENYRFPNIIGDLSTTPIKFLNI